MGAARRRSRGLGPARLDGTRPRATVASKVMESGKMAGQATATSTADRTASEARKPEAGSRAGGVSRAARGNDGSPTGARRRRRLDAKHDSATGHVSWPGTHGLQGSMYKLMRQSSGNRFGSDCRGLADPAQPVRRSLRGAKHRAVGIARRTFPWRQAKRAAPHKGRVGITPSRQGAGWIPIPASTAMTSPAGSAHHARTDPTARWAGRTR